MEYTVLTGDDMDILAKHVSAAIDRRWEPLGGMIPDGRGRFMQTLVLRGETKFVAPRPTLPHEHALSKDCPCKPEVESYR